MSVGIILIYIVLSLLIAYLGKNRKFGFWGFLFCSILLTPIVGFVAYLASCKKITIVLDNKEVK